MQIISVDLDAHLSGVRTTLCTCVRAQLTNGAVYAFTSHDQKIIIDEGGSPPLLRTYQAGAYTPSDVETTAALNVDNLEVHGATARPEDILRGSLLTEYDLNAGLWDYAQIKIFQLNYANLNQGIRNQRIGTLGEVSLDRDRFKAELRGILQAYSRVIGQLTQPGCRYIFGDARCKFLVWTVTWPATVLSVDADNIVITFSEGLTGSPPEVHPSGYYDYGKARFMSGENAGLEMEIKSHTVSDSPAVSTILLQLPPPYLISADSPPDTMELVKGCGKAPAHCKENDNYLNFGGEPDLQGNDKLLQMGRSGG